MKREKEQPITINDIADYLDGVGLQYLATIGLDGKPKVRPVQYMVVNDKKLYFCTNSQKAMYAELQKSPFIEYLKNICGSLANLGHVKGLEEKKDFALPVEFDL